MQEKWEDLYNVLVFQVSALCFGEGCRNSMEKSLVETWLAMNGLGLDDLKEWFEK